MADDEKIIKKNMLLNLTVEALGSPGIVTDPDVAARTGCKCYKVDETLMCYSLDTEIHTIEGFKYIDEITCLDHLTTLNIDDDEIIYQRPIAKQKFGYKGKMVHFDGKGYDLLVTPEHDHLVFDGCDKPETLEALEIYEILNKYKNPQSSDIKFARGGVWKGYKKESFTLPSTVTKWKSRSLQWKSPEIIEKVERLHEEGYSYRLISEKIGIGKTTVSRWLKGGGRNKYINRISNEKVISIGVWLKFFGWWITEGYTLQRNGAYSVVVTQTSDKHKDYLREIQYIIEEMGYHYITSHGQVIILDKQLYGYMSKFGKSHQRYIPTWIKQLQPTNLLTLIETMLKGDGSKDGKRFYSTSKKLADDFQEVLVKAGLSGSIYVDSRPIRKKPLYVVTVTERRKILIGKKPKLIPYNGYVFDLTVPLHHVILTRRNGKITWSCNCFSKGIIGTLSKPQVGAYCPVKDVLTEGGLVERVKKWKEAAKEAQEKIKDVPKGERLEPWLTEMSKALAKRGIEA